MDAFTKALIRATPGKDRMLEVGTGSGRLSQPLLAQGAKLIGLDLSHAKLRRLLARIPNLPVVVQADALQMPFPAASFDAVITVHVMHLVNRPNQVLFEFRRVLRPGGVYLRRSERPGNTIHAHMRHRWQTILEKAGLPQRHQARSGRVVDEILLAMGGSCQPLEVAHIDHATSPQREIERIASRVRAGAWLAPDGQLLDFLAELASWAAAEFGSLGREFRYREDVMLHVWRF